MNNGPTDRQTDKGIESCSATKNYLGKIKHHTKFSMRDLSDKTISIRAYL